MLSVSISEQITNCEIELAMLEGEQEELWASEENGADVQAELTGSQGEFATSNDV